MDERDLQDLANTLISDFKNDKETRQDWEESYTKGLDLLGFHILHRLDHSKEHQE